MGVNIGIHRCFFGPQTIADDDVAASIDSDGNLFLSGTLSADVGSLSTYDTGGSNWYVSDGSSKDAYIELHDDDEPTIGIGDIKLRGSVIEGKIPDRDPGEDLFIVKNPDDEVVAIFRDGNLYLRGFVFEGS